MRINRRGGSIMAGNGIWNKAFISLFCVNGLISLSQMMMNVLIALFADELGADTSLVGFAVSSFAYTALALKLISAPAIDSFNRKWLLAASLGILAVSYLIMSLSTTIVMLIVARLLQGCAMAFTTTACFAMATDTLPPDRISSGIGFFSMAQAACMAVGPMIGLQLASAFGYNAAFAVGCGMMIVSLLAPHDLGAQRIRRTRSGRSSCRPNMYSRKRRFCPRSWRGFWRWRSATSTRFWRCTRGSAASATRSAGTSR